MPVIACPSCGTQLTVRDEHQGKQVACPRCKQVLRVPAPHVPSEEATPTVRPLDEDEPATKPRKNAFADLDADDSDTAERSERPVRRREGSGSVVVPKVYTHRKCSGSTSISDDIVRMITSDPFWFISSTYCCGCQGFVGLGEVKWEETGETLAAYRARLRRSTPAGLIALRFLPGPVIGAVVGVIIAAGAKNPAGGIIGGLLAGTLVGYFVLGLFFRWFRNPRDVVRQAERK
jgi:predicted Zn finger-like uncharacterized protein